jgi:hypothetical protein
MAFFEILEGMPRDRSPNRSAYEIAVFPFLHLSSRIDSLQWC